MTTPMPQAEWDFLRDHLIMAGMLLAVLVLIWSLGTIMVSNALTKVLDERDERAAKRARETTHDKTQGDNHE